MRLPPRLTDWTLALALSLAAATGIISLISGEVWQWFVFAAHGMAGYWLLIVLWEKVRRVWPRLWSPRRWEFRTIFGAAGLLVVLLAIGSGIAWALGGDLRLVGFNLLNWHIVLGTVLVGVISLHMFARAKPLRVRDVVGRRQALASGARLVAGVALWPIQQTIEPLLRLPGARRRFTGSREASSFAGNLFPTSSWVADNPAPIDPETWSLAIGGAVSRPLSIPYAMMAAQGDELVATLDCTGGFFSTQRWRGMRFGTLLDRVGPTDAARYVSFVSITGYRWSLPLDEARNALIATHIDDAPLSHDHGAPARLVAPGRRGFEWVKWLAHVEVLTGPDPGQILSIWTSSLG